MAAAIPQLLQEAAKTLGEVVATLGADYLKALVANAFVPALQDAISQELSDAKEEAGLGGPEEEPVDRLAYNKDEKERDTFIVHVPDSHVMEPRLGPNFMAYDTFVVRIGSTGEEKDKQFYVNAQFFKVRYNQLHKVPDKVKKDFKDAVVPAFPAPYEMGGTCCFCITKKAGDKAAHDKAMRDYFSGLFQSTGYSPQVADHFRVGDNWETQQTAQAVFFQAITNAIADEGIDVWNPIVPPFDETEAITEFLKAYAIKKILPKMLEPLEQQEMPAVVKNRAIHAARSGVATAVEAASKAWEPLGVAARKAGEKATDKLKEAADKIVTELKPLIGKVVAIVKEKMKKKAEEKKGEEKEGKSLEEKKGKLDIGDIVKEWKFQLTPVGRNLHSNLTRMDSSEAIKASADEIISKLTEAIRSPIMGAVDSLTGGSYGVDSWTQWQIWWLARRICDFILAITTLDGFLEASKKLGFAVSNLEADFIAAAGKRDELEKLIDKASSALWQALADEAVGLWTKIWRLTDKINDVFSGQPDTVLDPLNDLLGDIFEAQVRGFNAMRVLYTRKLRERLLEAGDGDAIKEISRTALRDSIFEVVNLLALVHWTKLNAALSTAAQAYVLYRFTVEVWPSIKSALDELQSLLPDVVKSAGLDIPGLALKVASILIQKGVAWGMKKIGLHLERAIFAQDGEGA